MSARVVRSHLQMGKAVLDVDRHMAANAVRSGCRQFTATQAAYRRLAAFPSRL